MAQELTPEALVAVFTHLQGEAEARKKLAVGSIADAIVRAAKEDLTKNTHPHGTKTTATPGGPPALVSGTLRRSVVRTPATLAGLGWEVRVGTAAGFYPPYGGKRRTPSSRYGMYLEKGLRNGSRYPWLVPAYKRVRDTLAPGILITVFSAGWTKV
jgi:hypothetical protein